MAEKLLMTALSPTMEKGTISEWMKHEGDQVKNGDIICEVETDKAAMEYEADFDAFLLKIIVPEGSAAAVGEAIAVYGEKGEDISELLAEEPQKPEEPSEAAETTDSSDEVIDEKSSEPKPEPKPEAVSGQLDKADGDRVKASPLARKMAEEMHIGLQEINGSGPAGRIVKRDIETFKHSDKTSTAQGRVTEPSAMRSTIAKRLTESKFSAPHYYLTLRADMSAVLKSRGDIEKRTEKKISINSFLIKLASAALIRHPEVNSGWEDGKIRRFGTADIGFAVALEDGLVAPVIKHSEQKGIFQIDDEFKSLAKKAKSGDLKREDYSGAGFSISNLGGFGIEEFTAIINPPGAAILAVGAIIKEPVVVEDDSGEDQVEIKPMMKMTLSCDHRLIDGAVGAAFLADLRLMIESPVEALL